MENFTERKTPAGLYSPRFEHDNCGIGAVVDIKGRKSHKTIDDALQIVEHLEHRAGKDAEGNLVCLFIPGDHELNELKIGIAAGADDPQLGRNPLLPRSIRFSAWLTLHMPRLWQWACRNFLKDRQ